MKLKMGKYNKMLWHHLKNHKLLLGIMMVTLNSGPNICDHFYQSRKSCSFIWPIDSSKIQKKCDNE